MEREIRRGRRGLVSACVSRGAGQAPKPKAKPVSGTETQTKPSVRGVEAPATDDAADRAADVGGHAAAVAPGALRRGDRRLSFFALRHRLHDRAARDRDLAAVAVLGDTAADAGL